MSLLENVAQDLVLAQTADGSTDPDTTAVDMLGFDSCVFTCIVGAITGSGTVNMAIYQSADDVTYNAIPECAAQADLSADSDKLLSIEVVKPTDRYLKATITRKIANSILGGVITIRHKARKAPITQNASMYAATRVIADTPSE